MTFCFVSREYPPGRHGGIGTQNLAKATGLAARGHRCVVIASSPDKERHDALEDPAGGGVRVVRIPGYHARMKLYTEPADWLTYSADVAATIAEIDAQTPLDLVDFAEWGGEGFVHLINRTQWNRRPAVTVQLHGPLVMFAHTMRWPALDSDFFRVGTMMESASVRLADGVYSSSAVSIEWCRKHYGLTQPNVPVMHTGIDTRKFRPDAALKDERPTIVFVGKLVENKGVFTLLDAACELAREIAGLRLRLLGTGEPRVVERLKAKASECGFPDLLDLPGFISRADLPTHLARAHVFAAPSVYEGGPGFVYLEAMACGLPAIACAGSGASEAITPGSTGLLVPPNDPAALAAALRDLLTDPARRVAMGAAARAWAEREADAQRCLDKLEAFYVKVAREPAR
jgi:phosphatidylinositol alpha-1,6-mannosyltransferase